MTATLAIIGILFAFGNLAFAINDKNRSAIGGWICVIIMNLAWWFK